MTIKKDIFYRMYCQIFGFAVIYNSRVITFIADCRILNVTDTTNSVTNYYVIEFS